MLAFEDLHFDSDPATRRALWEMETAGYFPTPELKASFIQGLREETRGQAAATLDWRSQRRVERERRVQN